MVHRDKYVSYVSQGAQPNVGLSAGRRLTEAVRIVPAELDESRDGSDRVCDQDVKAGRTSPLIPIVAATMARVFEAGQIAAKKNRGRLAPM